MQIEEIDKLIDRKLAKFDARAVAVQEQLKNSETIKLQPDDILVVHSETVIREELNNFSEYLYQQLGFRPTIMVMKPEDKVEKLTVEPSTISELKQRVLVLERLVQDLINLKHAPPA